MNRTKLTNLKLSLARIGFNPTGMKAADVRRFIRVLRANHKQREATRAATG